MILTELVSGVTFRGLRFNATLHPQSPPLILCETVREESDDHYILGVTFHTKKTFEEHLRSVSRADSKNLGILKKSWRVFLDQSLLVVGCFVVL